MSRVHVYITFPLCIDSLTNTASMYCRSESGSTCHPAAWFVHRSKVEKTENHSIVFVFENRSGSQTDGNENGSGINGNTKIDKYDRKIDENER